ncbi:MAG: hypothetical protein AB1758_35405, partial [Candidatus Eremiobacterota bacterium]
MGRSGRDPAVAVVNGEAIRRSQLNRDLEQRFGTEVLNDMIHSRLIEQEARQKGVQVRPEELRQRVDEMA